MGRIEPLGLLYLAASLEKAGFGVAIMDMLSDAAPLSALLSLVEREKPLCVGLTGVTSNGSQVYRLGRALRERFPGIKIALGNLHASVFHEFYLKHGAADYVFHGESEATLPAALAMIRQGGRVEGIPGITYWEDGRIGGSAERQYIGDLDSLPFPARHLLPMERYGDFRTSNNLHVPRGDERTRFMFSSRGCIYRCTFCVAHDNRRFRVRSPSNVVDEMAELQERYRAAHVTFLDSVFVGDRPRVFALCEEIRNRRLRLPFSIEGHVNLVTPEMLRALKEAGCYGVYYGIESGDETVLKKVKKGTHLRRIREAVGWTRDARLKVAGYFMLGLPGDTLERMEATLRFAKSLPLDLAQFSVTMPYPGSELYDELKARGQIADPGHVGETLSFWDHYSPHPAFSGKTPVYAPEGLTPLQVVAFQKKALRSYYLRPKELLRYAGRLNRNNLRGMFRAAAGLFK